MCNNKGVCQMGEAPAINCRTCEYSKPISKAEWHCSNEVCPGVIPKELMLTGCSHYERKKEF